MKQKISSEICKRNMKLFPLYTAISSDFLFFYTINFLFLTQIKNISASAVILEDSFYALFVVLLQIPSSLIVDLIGRKKGMMLGNFSNIIYMIIVILSKNLFHLITAEVFCAFAFSLKDVADLSLINESIPETTKKSTIFAKILAKGSSRYFVLNSLSLIISGFLFTVNGYLPIIISLIITILSFLLSCLFIEPLEEESPDIIDENNKKLAIENFKLSIQNFASSFKFILSSKRLRSLILFSSIMSGLISILANMQVGILEETNISSFIIGIIFAIFEIIASISLKKQEQFHNKFKNKSLSVLGLTISFSCILAGSSRIYHF